jgi:site-specific DNA recombinase
MLKNEKYKGDTMLQKTYTKNYLTGERAVNDEQRVRYYIADSHQAIVSKEIFDRVQE